VLLPAAMALLPESIEFLLLKRPKNALERLNAILARLRQPREDVLPAPPEGPTEQKVPMAELFSSRYLRSTLLICAAFFIVLLNNYFLLSWTPTLLVDFGMSVEGGISGSLLMHIGAIAGGIAIGAFTASLPMRVWSAVFMVILFVTVMLFATLPGPLWLLLAVSVAIGFFGNGAATSLYPIVTAIYPARLRASGTGLAIGIGRLGAIISPYAVGVLMGAGWPRPAYCFVMCVPLLLAAGLVLAIRAGAAQRAEDAGREPQSELVRELAP
jgi:MFS family permease